MIEITKETLKNFKNVKILEKDVLKVPNFDLISELTTKEKREKERNYKIVANLPYYLTGPLIRKFLTIKNPPKLMVLMIQKEVAQRICAQPPKMNLLAVSVQFYAQPEIITFVSKKFFWPKPKVDGAIIKITPKPLFYLPSKFNEDLFFKIVRAGFSHPRKQLLNNLSTTLKLDKNKLKTCLLENDIQPNQRAEALTLTDWLKLFQIISNYNLNKTY